jgi:hypothetical protein
MAAPLVTDQAPANPPRAAWPLIVLAVLAFIPFLGILFAAIAVTWALVSDRPRTRLVIGIAAVGALCTFVEMFVISRTLIDTKAMKNAQLTMARDDLAKIVSALEDYRRSHESYPTNLMTLVSQPVPTRLLNIYDHSAGIFKMTLYRYQLRDDGTYDLFAVGPDDQPGTGDDIRPILADSVAAHSGYRPSAVGL